MIEMFIEFLFNLGTIGGDYNMGVAPFLVPMLISGGLSLGSNLFAGAQNAKKGREMDRIIKARSNDLTGWYKNNYYKDFMETDTALSTLSNLKSQMRDSLKNLSGNAVKRGATTESNVASRGELMKQYARAINQLAGYGTQYQRGIRQDYLQNMSYLDQLRLNRLQGGQQSISNMAGNMTGSLSNLASIYAMGGMGGGAGGGADGANLGYTGGVSYNKGWQSDALKRLGY
ncbi:MAG: hypothetical protein RBT65_05990 [Methanolobus sp.]|nr:hypothetical protein [Methanolobus sp.]